MKKRTLIIALLLLVCVACQKEPAPVATNHFINTCWESINPLALTMTFDFISDKECKVTTKVPFFAAKLNFYDYTYNGYKASLIGKSTSTVDWVCVINGGTFTVEGRTEVFTRTK